LFIHEKTIKFGRADQWYDGSFNLKIPKPKASERQQWQGTEKLHQVAQWCPKTPSDHPIERKNLGRTQAQSGASSPLAFMN